MPLLRRASQPPARRDIIQTGRHGIGLLALLVAAALQGFGEPARADETLPSNAWSLVGTPTAGPPRSFGSFANGCIAGAMTLPVDGTGYEAIRLSRHRYYGQPATIRFVETLGRHAVAAGISLFYVGDMGQPRGGPLPYGHASHQNGLDVDIWLTLNGTPNLPPNARDVLDLPSMLKADGSIDTARFRHSHIALLKLAAADPAVERIFISPAIKLALCRNFGGASADGTAWLHKLSPWWGHDDHFHVRLGCPIDSPDCLPQPPVAPGDGCDAGLEHWAHHLTPPSVATSPPRRILPAACQSVLTAPAAG